MSKRITLYQRLKPEAKAGLESIKNEPYKFSGDFLFEPELNEAP